MTGTFATNVFKMSDTYCVLPFRHAYIDNTGIAGCCRSPRHYGYLEDWQTHPELKKLQQQVLSGDLPKPCIGCMHDELQQGTSLRTQSNLDYQNQKVTDTLIDFVDYRSSNICNFKCRTCIPTFSHGIAHDARHNAQLLPFYNHTPLDKVARVQNYNLEWILENLGQIKRIMFTGGEPTCIPDIKVIIENVAKHHADTVSIIITSNGSFEDNFWFDITKKIKNLHWTLSIDATDKDAGIIRHGTNWDLVKSNVSWLSHNASSFYINSVISNLNIFLLDKLFTQVNEWNPHKHQYHIIRRPEIHAANNLSSDLQQQAIEYVNKLDCQRSEHADIKQGLINDLVEDVNELLWQRALAFHNILDSMRQETVTHLWSMDHK